MLVIGVDEAGRGPLAGPVVAAAVAFPETYKNSEIKDSKQLSRKKREILSEVIKHEAAAWAVVAVGHKRIDQMNIREAARKAMSLAVQRVEKLCDAQLVLVDGNMTIHPAACTQRTIVGGDRLHVQISAASILAKVWRDGLMKKLDRKYPGYGFAKHAGYPTKEHKRQVAQLGPSKIHRLTFRGVREHIQSMPASLPEVRRPRPENPVSTYCRPGLPAPGENLCDSGGAGRPR